MTEQQPNQAVATQKRPIDVIKQDLLTNDSLINVLPKHIDKDRFIRIAVASIAQTPALLECNRASLYSAIMTAAQLGLVTDGVLGQAYIIPYKGKAQMQVGYKGLLKLAWQSNEISDITMEAVYENDRFEYELGDAAKITHKPALINRGKSVGYYAIAKLKNGGIMREFMSDSDVEKIRVRSPSANSPAWKESREEMGKKTVFRRLAKKLPLSTDNLAHVIAMEERVEGTREIVNATPAGLVVDNTMDVEQPKKRGRKTAQEKLAEFVNEEPIVSEPEPAPIDTDDSDDIIIPDFLRGGNL